MPVRYRLIDTSAGLALLERRHVLYKDLNKFMKVIAHSFLYSLLVKIDLVFFGFNPECLLKLDWQSLESSGNSLLESK